MKRHLAAAIAAFAIMGSIAIADPGGNTPAYSPGLVAHYYRDAQYWNGVWPNDLPEPADTVKPRSHTLSQYSYTRVEPLVNHYFIRSGWFSARWQGYLDTHPGNSGEHGQANKGETASYTFTVIADDGCRLYIDDVLVIDSWVPMSELNPDSVRSASVDLAPGKHRIVLEYFQGQSLAASDTDPIRLKWRSDSQGIPSQVIPASHLSHTLDDLEPTTGRMD